MTDEKYQEALAGIALARETVRQVTQAIRDGMDAGDDPVVILHNMAGSLSKEAPFQTGGHGSAVFVTACFLLADSGFFDEAEPACICPGPEGKERRAPVEFLAYCPVHRGSWAATLEIMADRKVMTDLAESVEDLGDIEANFTEVGDPTLDAMVAEEFESWDRERNGGAEGPGEI